MAAQWHEVYRYVAQKLQHFVDNAPTPLWHNVFNEALNRWKSRQDFIDGKLNAELTIKINVVDENAANRAMERITQFAQQFGNIESENVRVVMLGQRYQKDGNLSVLLRIRIVAKTQKMRSKFVASADDV